MANGFDACHFFSLFALFRDVEYLQQSIIVHVCVCDQRH